MSIERITRTARQECFNGGHTRGPIEPAHNPRKDLGWGMVVCSGAMLVVWFAVVMFA